MKVLWSYNSFNPRRYGNPWVAMVDPNTAKPNFDKKVGGYTGGYNAGEAGDLYITDPQENTVYMYGQKDYRGKSTERGYVLYQNGEFTPVTSQTLISVLASL